MRYLCFLLLALVRLWLASGDSPEVVKFKYRSYHDIVVALKDINQKYPDLTELTNAQDAYQLQSPGSCGADGPCKQYILRITNEKTLDHSKVLDERPEVFFSGEIHGNERVGPNAVMEFIFFVLETYTHQIESNPWINRLVDSRSIYLMPTANALGYYRDNRLENLVDPNRDYPIDNKNEAPCMRAITSRAINELWREHMFQLALTFHGGMQAIAFEWGTYSHKRNDHSPDDTAQLSLGTILSAYAGAYPSRRYPHKRMNPLVYPVHGGMEDWGYAASWEKQGGVNKPCRPTSFGGYPESKTKYTESQLRVFNILIETSDRKTPSEATLGDRREILRPEGAGDGHLPRNVRLILLMTDLVQPYLQWTHILSLPSQNGACGGKAASGWTDKERKGVYELSLAAGQQLSLSLSYDVGGAVFVDKTLVLVGELSAEVYRSSQVDQPGFGWSAEQLTETFGSIDDAFHSYVAGGEQRGASPALRGPTRWAGGGIGNNPGNLQQQEVMSGQEVTLAKANSLDDRAAWPYIPAWNACMPAPTKEGLYFVMAVAKVDQEWRTDNVNPSPNLPPQSHIVNARTNLQWDKSNAGHRIKGRTEWYSKPLILRVGDLSSVTTATVHKAEETNEVTKEVTAPEVNRNSNSSSNWVVQPVKVGTQIDKSKSKDVFDGCGDVCYVIQVGVLLSLFAVIGFVFRRVNRKSEYRQIIQDNKNMETEFEQHRAAVSAEDVYDDELYGDSGSDSEGDVQIGHV